MANNPQLSYAAVNAQALQATAAVGDTPVRPADIYTFVIDPPAAPEPLAIIADGVTEQVPQLSEARGFVQRVVRGACSTTQPTQSTQAGGFQEDEAEVLALLIGLAA